jgi:hypothetical protein
MRAFPRARCSRPRSRLGTRDDVTPHKQYVDDITASIKTAIGAVNPVPYFQKYGENIWGGVKEYLDAVTAAAAAPVIKKYTGSRCGRCVHG